MNTKIIHAYETTKWREVLNHFSKVDVCHLPEYHQAYSTRFVDSIAMMWVYEEDKKIFAYPFMKTKVSINTDYSDISSVYGYTGPLTNSTEESFLKKVWGEFDEWAQSEKIIADFTRFSIFVNNKLYAHPDCEVIANRPSAISYLYEDETEFFKSLNSKTRNMIRKAQKLGLVAKELDPLSSKDQFKLLYNKTMERNKATTFFNYEDDYYDLLLKLPKGEVRIFGVFHLEQLVSVAMALAYKENALYHLGANLSEYSNLGSGNLVMYEMSRNLGLKGVRFLTVGGGRTTHKDDSLFLFKKNNASSTDNFHIGKRIINPIRYQEVVELWQQKTGKRRELTNLIFYR